MKKILTILMFVLMTVSYVFASEKPVWVEATGEAALGDLDTVKEVKGRAKNDARSKALEKAVGVFLKSHTLVSNNQIAEELVYATVRGKIDEMEVLQEGWDTENQHIYRVKIKALITPIYPEKGEGMSVKLSLSKSRLKEGENVKIFYQASADCYAYIFSVASDGSVTLLFPNSQNKDNSIKKAKTYEFPPAGNQIQLQAMFLPEFKGKMAEEKVKLIITKSKDELLPLGFQEGMFKVYDANATGMISDLVKRLNQMSPTDWADATALYTIER